MILNIFKKNKLVIVLILLSFLLIGTQTVLASNVKEGLDTTAGIGLGDGDIKNVPFEDTTDPSQIIGRVIGIGLSFIAVLFFGLMIYGGFNWMMARGNEEDAKKALDLIQAAIFGLIIVLMAYAIMKFITSIFITN